MIVVKRDYLKVEKTFGHINAVTFNIMNFEGVLNPFRACMNDN